MTATLPLLIHPSPTDEITHRHQSERTDQSEWRVCACCMRVAVGGGAKSTMKGLNMSSNRHQHRASVADTTGLMFIPNQCDHREITANSSDIYYSMAP